MVKRIAFLFLILTISIVNITLGYESNYCKIDFPDNFEEQINQDTYGIYLDEDGNVFGVTVLDNDAKMKFTEEFLDKVVEGLSKDIDSRREEIKSGMRKQYGNTLTDEYIEEYANNVKINVLKKEITTFGEENYKCFHYVAFIDMVSSNYYVDAYQTQSGNKQYMVSISSNNYEFIESNKYSDIIKTFKIKNYEEPKSDNKVTTVGPNSDANKRYRRTENFLIIACVVCSVFGLIGIKNNNKKNGGEKNEKDNN